jgi:hypothetical protein
MKTMEWADVTWRSANAVNSGKPTTTPRATKLSATHSARAGRTGLTASSSTAAMTAAMVARAEVRNSGGKSATAMRVAGRDALKMTIPISPLSQPAAARCILFS